MKKHRIVMAALAMACAAAQAQTSKLPPPTREAFRCESGGKVTYTDTPCLGAKKIELVPTRGLSGLSGKERVGADVRNERTREAIAEAVRPATGMDAKQLDTFGRRSRLPRPAQVECAKLDQAIPAAEAEERAAKGPALQRVQMDLLQYRQRFIQLGC